MSGAARAAGRLLLGLAAVAGGGAIAWHEVPTLWQDAGIRAHPREIGTFGISDGQCRNRKGLATCSAHVSYAVDGRDFERDIDVKYFSLDLDDREVGLVVDARDPGRATFDIGVDRFWNRVLATLFLSGSLAGLGVHWIVDGLRRLRARR